MGTYSSSAIKSIFRLSLLALGLVSLSSSCYAQYSDQSQSYGNSPYFKGISAYGCGKYAEAERIWRDGLKKASISSSPSQLYNLALTAQKLALLLVDEGRDKEATPFYLQALRYAKGNDRLTASVLIDLGALYQIVGRYKEAESCEKRAIVLNTKALDASNPQTAVAQSYLSRIYMDEGCYSTAAPLLRAAENIAEKAYGKKSVERASAMNDLGLDYVYLGRLTDAELFLNQSLTIEEANYGKDSLPVANVQNNLALLRSRQGRTTEAEVLYKNVLRIGTASKHKDDLGAATTMSNLGDLYKRQSRLSEAQMMYSSALQIRKNRLGEKHPDTERLIADIASLSTRH